MSAKAIIPDLWNKLKLLYSDLRRLDGKPADASWFFLEITGTKIQNAGNRWGLQPRDGQRSNDVQDREGSVPLPDITKICTMFQIDESLLTSTPDAASFAAALRAFRKQYIYFEDLLAYPFGTHSLHSIHIDILEDTKAQRINPLRGFYDHHGLIEKPRTIGEQSPTSKLYFLPGTAIRIHAQVPKKTHCIFVFSRDSQGWQYWPTAAKEIGFCDSQNYIYIPNSLEDEVATAPTSGQSLERMCPAPQPFYVSTTPGPTQVLIIVKLTPKNQTDENIHDQLLSSIPSKASAGRSLLLGEMNRNSSDFLSQSRTFYTVLEPRPTA